MTAWGEPRSSVRDPVVSGYRGLIQLVNEVVHLSAKGHPLEIEILDASKVVQKKDVEVSMEALFSAS